MVSHKTSPCCCHCCPAASCRGRPDAATAADGPVEAENAARRYILDKCSRPKKIPLLTEAVEAAVERCSTCRCWDTAGIPPEQRSFYCCLCMQQRKRDNCIFWASPWQSSYRTFAAFSDPIDADAAAAEHHILRPSGSSNSNRSTAALRYFALFGKIRRLLRAACPLFLVLCSLYFSWTMTGPLPQVLFLVGAFFSCIPFANAIAAIVRVREERLTIIGDFGVQFSHKKLLGSSKRFVPMSQVRDVVISEEVQVYRVAYHVAIILSDEQEIIVPFQEFALRLEDCLAAYEALHCLLRTQIRGAANSGSVQPPASEQAPTQA